MPYKDIQKRREHSKQYYRQHKNYWKTKSYKNKKSLYDKKYRKMKNKKIKLYQNKYTNQKRQKDINFKLSTYLRNRIYCALKRNVKSKSTIKLLGCSIDLLRLHLQSKFRPGMSFDNYGKEWEIDHIIPCARFDLSRADEQVRCFHYTNLQPLWKSENRIKHTKVNVGERLSPT
jgi:hypothetical protein